MGKAIKLWADEVAWELLQKLIHGILEKFQQARDDRIFKHIHPSDSARFIDLVSDYASSRPTDSSRVRLATAFKIPPEVVAEINHLISELENRVDLYQRVRSNILKSE